MEFGLWSMASPAMHEHLLKEGDRLLSIWQRRTCESLLETAGTQLEESMEVPFQDTVG